MEQSEDAACPPLTEWFLTCFVGRCKVKGVDGVKEAAIKLMYPLAGISS